MVLHTPTDRPGVFRRAPPAVLWQAHGFLAHTHGRNGVPSVSREESRSPALAAVELHTPCSIEDRPRPPHCPYGKAHFADHIPQELRGRCRQAKAFAGQHLWFGSARPDERPWLQVGPEDSADGRIPRMVSGVCGQVWVSHESGGVRVMVENLSTTVTIEVRSPRLPRPVHLYPVDGDTGSARDRWLGTAITALQSPRCTLVLVNHGMEFPIWVSQLTTSWGTDYPHTLTLDPTRVPSAEGKDAERAVAAQQELDEAALRVELAANHRLLRQFFDQPQVRSRLEDSPTLRSFVESTANRSTARTPLDFCELQLRRVDEGAPSHELHRLILEGLGQPPEHTSKHYSELVRAQLNPNRKINHTRGGAAPGLAELIPRVMAAWRHRPGDLMRYLGLERGLDRGPELGGPPA
jgi:hypothetical protein